MGQKRLLEVLEMGIKIGRDELESFWAGSLMCPSDRKWGDLWSLDPKRCPEAIMLRFHCLYASYVPSGADDLPLYMHMQLPASDVSCSDTYPSGLAFGIANVPANILCIVSTIAWRLVVPAFRRNFGTRILNAEWVSRYSAEARSSVARHCTFFTSMLSDCTAHV